MVISPADLARHYYRAGLGAAARRDLSAALGYAEFARLLDPDHEGASRLAEICRYERGGAGETPEALEQITLPAGRKKWKAAALAAQAAAAAKATGAEAFAAGHQSVWLLNIQGCLWALAKRYGPAADCFAKALAKDRGDTLAAAALAELGRRRRFLGGFFCSSLTK